MNLEELKRKIKEDNPYFKNMEIKDYQVFDLLTLNEEKANCKKCSGLNNCLNSKKGFEPFIDESNNISYTRCKFMQNELDLALKSEKLNMMYISSNVSKARLEGFRLDDDKRIKCMQYARNFINSYKSDSYTKGAYICGDTGKGKTYLLSAIANALIEKNCYVTLVYFPDLINDLKDDFDKLNSKINELKKTEILILDDFGVGNMTSWVRDSILAPILNYRLSDCKPVFISSNIPFGKLSDYLKVKDDRDTIPSARIVRRIYELCDYLEI